jgi:hypothetical protein
MRATNLVVHGNQVFEIFTRRATSRLRELWVAGTMKRRRVLIHHYLTHDDLEAGLSYAKHGDLVWADVSPSSIPRRSVDLGFVMGGNVPQGHVIDHAWLAYHLPIESLPMDRIALAGARRRIPGLWSDGAIRVTLGPSRSATLSQPTPRGHPLTVDRGCPPPDRWALSRWQLFLTSSQGHCGLRVAVLRVDDGELHIARARGQGGRIAHIFRRVHV